MCWMIIVSVLYLIIVGNRKLDIFCYKKRFPFFFFCKFSKIIFRTHSG